MHSLIDPSAAESQNAQLRVERVRRAVKALSDDFARQGSFLRRRQVDRYFDKRRLTPEECVEVLTQLREAGVDIRDDAGSSQAKPDTEHLQTGSARSHRPASDALASVLNDPRTSQLLTAQEEVDLGRAISLGARAEAADGGIECVESERERHQTIARAKGARERMIVSNVRLVLSVAAKYQRLCDTSLEDLFQEGMIGLMKAVERFDHTRGFKFSTYATWWIRQSITRAIADKGQLVRFPVHVVERINKFKRAQRILTRMRDGRPPSLRNLADELGWDPGKVQFISELARCSPVSMESNPVSGSDLTLADTLVSEEPRPDEIAQAEDVAAHVRSVLSDLTSRERDIVEKRFGILRNDEMTLEQIGQQYELTRERIRQIESKALRKLRHPSRSQRLVELLSSEFFYSDPSLNEESAQDG